MKRLNQSLIAVSLAFLVPIAVHAVYAQADDSPNDSIDTQFHSQIFKKVQQDHAADIKAGKIATHSHAKAKKVTSTVESQDATSSSSGSSSSTTTNASAAAATGITMSTAGGTSGTMSQPTQVQQAQHKKKTTPPPSSGKH